MTGGGVCRLFPLDSHPPVIIFKIRQQGMAALAYLSIITVQEAARRWVMSSLMRWDPFRELEDVSERLNRMIRRPATPTSGKESMTVADWTPTVDISETDGEYQIQAEIPDVRKEDVKITLEDGILTIQGERKQEKKEQGKRYHRVEWSYGSFVRSFSGLPDLVDQEKIKAEFRDGVLNLHLPKSEKVKSKEIDVKIS